VRGPFGGGLLQVAGDRRELEVTSRGETRVLGDPETELSELLGWWLPVGSLRAWLLGMPDPDFPARTDPNPDGTLASLEQRLWRVEFASYQLAGDDAQALLVPRRIDLSHEDLEVRVTIDRWRPASLAAAP
jgi:outer membrane lipoprotein LolB